MAIAFDSAASASNGAAADSLTFSHTIGGGADRIVLIESTYVSATETSTATYNGTAATFAETAESGPLSTDQVIDFFRLLHADLPAAGTYDVVVNRSGSNAVHRAGARSYTGVHQTTPFGTFATAGGASMTRSVSPAADVSDVVVDTFRKPSAGGAPVQDASQTLRWGMEGTQAGGSEEAGASPSVAMSWTWDGTLQLNCIVAVALKPAAAAGRISKLAGYGGGLVGELGGLAG